MYVLWCAHRGLSGLSSLLPMWVPGILQVARLNKGLLLIEPSLWTLCLYLCLDVNSHKRNLVPGSCICTSQGFSKSGLLHLEVLVCSFLSPILAALSWNCRVELRYCLSYISSLSQMAAKMASVEPHSALLSFKATGPHSPHQSSNWFKVTISHLEDAGAKLRAHVPTLVLVPGRFFCLVSGFTSACFLGQPVLLLSRACFDQLLRSGIKGRVPISWSLSWLR